MDQNTTPNTVFKYDVSNQCTVPRPKSSRYLDINLCFSTYMPMITSKSYSSAVLSMSRLYYVKARTSLYAENNPLGLPNPDSSTSTSQTFLICCAAMVQFVSL